MRAMAALIFAIQFGLGAINPVIELYVRELFADVDPADVGWLRFASLCTGRDLSRTEDAVTFATSLLFGGMALANLLALRSWGSYGDRVGHRRALLLCAAGCAAALYLQASAALFVVLALGRVLTGVAMAGVGPLAFGLAAGEVHAEKRGGAFGVVFSARTFAIAVGAQLGGWLSGLIGIRALMLVAGTVVVCVLLAFARASARRAR
jgi:MFS family permease